MHRCVWAVIAFGSWSLGCFPTSATPTTTPASQPPVQRDPAFDRTAADLEQAVAEHTNGYEVLERGEGDLTAYAPLSFAAKRGQCHVLVLELLEGARWSDHAMQILGAEGRRPGEPYTINHGNIVYGPGLVIDNGCVQQDGDVSIDVVAVSGSAMDKSRVHELGTGPFRWTLHAKTIGSDEIAALERQRAADWEQAGVEAERDRQEREARERQAEAERQARQSQAAAPASSSGSSGSAGPSVVSVALKNSCPSTVKLFFGNKPKFGSGRYSTIGSNTRQSESMRPGDMVWIVDDAQNGISSATISPSTRELEITGSCTGLSAR